MFASLTRKHVGLVSRSCSGTPSCRGVVRNAIKLRPASISPQQAAYFGIRHSSTRTPIKDEPLVGVAAALAASSKDIPHAPTLYTHDFSLSDRVALITGGNSGIGLEVALAFLEAGARTVYCVDLPASPSDAWHAVQRYSSGLQIPSGGKPGRLEYVQGDVTDQKRMWKIAEDIGDKEDRLDVCFAGAGIAPLDSVDCLDYPADVMRRVLEVNTTGVLFTAQAAGRQMVRFGRGGSIVLVGSIAGSIALQDIGMVAYGASKGAVLQMTRSMACELAPRGVRVNSLSPGYTYTPYVPISPLLPILGLTHHSPRSFLSSFLCLLPTPSPFAHNSRSPSPDSAPQDDTNPHRGRPPVL
ncbi:hypothetical protein EIP86_009169 [Pleurotus ostreatoroseus]|nr:hypothetical protein EIP86_009169 [Pleurotus ostreatoroseus]